MRVCEQPCVCGLPLRLDPRLCASLGLPASARHLAAAAAQLKKGASLPPLPVWVVDLDSLTWTPLATTGQVPSARGGHTVRAT
jgi:hypothetical protein